MTNITQNKLYYIMHDDFVLLKVLNLGVLLDRPGSVECGNNIRFNTCNDFAFLLKNDKSLSEGFTYNIYNYNYIHGKQFANH